MPTPKPPVRYRWENLAKDTPMALLERRRVIGEQAMISEVLLKKGCLVPVHSHENEQFSVVLRGKIRFEFAKPGEPGAEPLTLVPGEVLHLPSGCPHGAEAIEETLILDIFAPPSATTGIDKK